MPNAGVKTLVQRKLSIVVPPIEKRDKKKNPKLSSAVNNCRRPIMLGISFIIFVHPCVLRVAE